MTKCYPQKPPSEIRTPEIRTPEIRTPEIRIYVFWAIYKVLTIQSTDEQNTKIKKY